MDKRQIKAIVFDFDGVIADSKSVKRDAWRSVFSDRDERDRELLEREVSSRRGNRYDILQRTFSALGVVEEELDRLVRWYADRYNELVQAGIRDRGLSPGVVPMLERLRARYPLYISTATPEIGIHETVETFALRGYFRNIFGSTSGSKEDHLRRVVRELGVQPAEVVMVGDEEGDRAAAEETGVRFVGIADSVNRWSSDRFPHPLLASAAALEGILESA